MEYAFSSVLVFIAMLPLIGVLLYTGKKLIEIWEKENQ